MYGRYTFAEKLSLVLFTALLVMGLLSTLHKIDQLNGVGITRLIILVALVPLQVVILLQN